MISLDVRNSYALRRAADAPGSVGQTQRRYTHLQVDDVRDEMLNIAQMENNMIMQESLKTMKRKSYLIFNFIMTRCKNLDFTPFFTPFK